MGPPCVVFRLILTAALQLDMTSLTLPRETLKSRGVLGMVKWPRCLGVIPVVRCLVVMEIKDMDPQRMRLRAEV